MTLSLYQPFGREHEETYSAVSFAVAVMHELVSAIRPKDKFKGGHQLKINSLITQSIQYKQSIIWANSKAIQIQ